MKPEPFTTSNDEHASSVAKCSMCGQRFQIDESRFMPFCSRRCQQMDLRRWLNETYGFPIESETEGEFEQDPVEGDE